MVIDTKGQIQGSWPLTSLSFPFELPFADDVVVKNGRVVTYVARLHFVPDTERRLLVASLLLVGIIAIHKNINGFKQTGVR